MKAPAILLVAVALAGCSAREVPVEVPVQVPCEVARELLADGDLPTITTGDKADLMRAQRGLAEYAREGWRKRDAIADQCGIVGK